MNLISIVIPAKDECENIQPLVNEIYTALMGHYTFEIIYIDDGSTDGTFEEIIRLKNAGKNELYALKHKTSVGQSTAIYSGIHAAKGELIVTLDADGQNDPADIPNMLIKAQKFTIKEHFCIAGYRKNRKDTAWYRFQSRLANKVRSRLLRDETPDTGCGLKVFPKATFLQLPYFDHMHRFIPALIGRLQGQIVISEVQHRNRQAGISKYTLWNRLWVGIVDMFGVMWLQRRTKYPSIIDQV